jgi:hypothetical protein
MDAPFGAISLSGTAGEYTNTANSGTGYDGSGRTILGGTNSSELDLTTNNQPYGEIKGNIWYRCGLAFGSTGTRTVVSITNLVVGNSYTITSGGTNPNAWRTVGAPATNNGTYFRATGSDTNNNGTATLIEDSINSLASITSGNKIASRNQMFRTNTARSSSGASDAALVAIFGSNVTNLSTTNSTTLANSNHVNLDPGFTVPLSGRIAQGSLAFTPSTNNTVVRDGAWTINRNRAPQLADLTPAPHIGAVRNNAWYLTWTMLGQSGILRNTEESIEPVVSVTANGTNARVSFASINGVKYSVERSTDNKKFESIAIVDGNNGTVNYDDNTVTGTINSTPKFYRVLAL